MLRFNKGYFIVFISLLVTEVLIAIYLKDDFIRPFFGDFLATIFVYVGIKSFFDLSPLKALFYSLLISFTIEILQYVDILALLNLKSNRYLRIVFGTSFSWGDMLAYSLGGLFVFAVDRLQSSKTKSR